MPKRGQFGCQNCEACGRSAVGKAARATGRMTADFSTLGMWRVGRALKKKCGVCGHLMKFHQVAPTMIVGGSPPTQWPQARAPQAPITQAPQLPQRPVAQATNPTGSSPISVAEELRKLAELKESGFLTDQEFAAQKARLLGAPEPNMDTLPGAELDQFDVILHHARNKIDTIQTIRALTGLGYDAARDLVNSPVPKPLLVNISRQRAEVARAQLEATGASVEVNYSSRRWPVWEANREHYSG